MVILKNFHILYLNKNRISIQILISHFPIRNSYLAGVKPRTEKISVISPPNQSLRLETEGRERVLMLNRGSQRALGTAHIIKILDALPCGL